MPSKLGIEISRHVFILLILPLLASAQDIAGWQSSNGFEHFRPLADKSWTLAGGTFTTVRDPRILQDLVTKEAYDNFELALDWRIEPGGNSGVKYRIKNEVFLLHEQPGYLNGRRVAPGTLGPTQRGQFYNAALEFQFLDDQRHPDGRLGATRHTGAIYNLKAPTTGSAHPPGEWNTLRLIVNAGRIEHWINDKLVLSAALTDPALNPRLGPPSPITLQNHADSIAQFRNVKIRRLLPLTQTHLPVQAELGFPSSVAAAPNGEIYLLQRGLTADPIVVINRQGKVLRQWGKGLFEIPHSIRLSPDGHVWTVDAASSRILKFTPQGKLLLSINVGEQPKTKSTFNGTADIAFAANGHLFIADGYGNARILEYSADGQRLNQWGTPGTAPGQFNLPHGIAIDSDGIVYVADRENGRIQRFTQTGKFLNEFNGHGKTFSLTIADGALWIGSQPLDQPNGTPGWLKKLDHKTGATLGVVDSPGHHSVDVTADGEIFTAVRPDRLLWFKR
ncbi:MAG: DUF1080 domain-containing protein [Acidobacteria bacterium]|nr:DUF1080 domain-containing protein [Acidobacteriota bacterium]